METFDPFRPPQHWLPCATDVACPVCGRQPREACKNAAGITLWGKPHKQRIKLARQAKRQDSQHFSE